MSQNAWRYRATTYNLTPWARAGIGATSGIDMPPGYWLSGDARSSAGPWTLLLYRKSERGPDQIIEHRSPIHRDVRGVFLELVAAAWQHHRGTVVTTDGDGWITSIEEGGNG